MIIDITKSNIAYIPEVINYEKLAEKSKRKLE